jgi:hypothetical protein
LDVVQILAAEIKVGILEHESFSKFFPPLLLEYEVVFSDPSHRVSLLDNSVWEVGIILISIDKFIVVVITILVFYGNRLVKVIYLSVYLFQIRIFYQVLICPLALSWFLFLLWLYKLLNLLLL